MRELPSDADYARLLTFRNELRRFERWSNDQAAAAGLTSAQHQLLVAVRGHADPLGPTVGELAAYLFVRHHSAVELVNRAVCAGLVERRGDPADARLVRLALTAEGARRVSTLAGLHLEEIARLEPLLHSLVVGHTPVG